MIMATQHTKFAAAPQLVAFSTDEEAKPRFKPFYIHKMYDNNNGPVCSGTVYRGFSAFIEPADKPHEVLVYVVKCHKSDEFNKAKARAYLAKALPVQMNARKVDHFLAEVENEMCPRRWASPWPQSWTWVFKYMM